MGKFKELGSIDISNENSFVISKTVDGEYSIAKRLNTFSRGENGEMKKHGTFIKNSSFLIDFATLKKINNELDSIIFNEENYRFSDEFQN